MQGLKVLTLTAFLSLAVDCSWSCKVGSNACGERMMVDLISSQSRFPSAYFLEAHCGTFNETMSCIVQDARNCPSSPYGKLLEEYEEIHRIILLICDLDSSFRAAYTRSLSCYNDNLNIFSTCSSTRRQVVNEFMVEETNELTVFNVSPFKYECIAMSIVRNCQIKEIDEKCGVNEESPMTAILLSSSNLMLNPLCEAHDMAVWSDEFYEYLVNLQTAPEPEPEPSAAPVVPPAEAPAPPAEGNAPPSEGPLINDVINDFVHASKAKLPKYDIM